MALTVWCLWREKNHNSSAGKQTRDLLIKLQVLYQLSYQGIHAFSSPQDWSQSSDYMLCTVCPYRLVTYDLWFEGLPPCVKVHLDCLAAYVKIVIMTIDGSDSLVPVERKNHNSSARKQTWDLLIKLQVLYQLSYQGIHAFSSPQDWSQSSDHMLCTICPYRLVTYDLWFEGLPLCVKVHLDCLAAYVKIVIMTIDGSDSLVPVERKNHNSSAGKQTRDLLIKLQVLYQTELPRNPCFLISTRLVTVQ